MILRPHPRDGRRHPRDRLEGFPLYSLVLLSALQAVPEDLYEAASLDGAGPLTQFLHVTLPSILPSVALLAVLAFIYSMQQFTLIWLITGGPPVDATLTLAPAIYMQAFRFYDFGYASAMAVVGLVFAAVATLAFIAVQRRMADDPRMTRAALPALRAALDPPRRLRRALPGLLDAAQRHPARRLLPHLAARASPPAGSISPASPASSARSRSASGSRSRPGSPPSSSSSP